jgi:hypothetical protein
VRSVRPATWFWIPLKTATFLHSAFQLFITQSVELLDQQNFGVHDHGLDRGICRAIACLLVDRIRQWMKINSMDIILRFKQRIARS